MTCCAAARDEFGVSYALYASWQMVTISRREPGQSREQIVRSLTAVMIVGFWIGLSTYQVSISWPNSSGTRQELVSSPPRSRSRWSNTARRRSSRRRVPGWPRSVRYQGRRPRHHRHVARRGRPDARGVWNGPQGHRGVLIDRTPWRAGLAGGPQTALPSRSRSAKRRGQLASPLRRWSALVARYPRRRSVARGPSADPEADRRRDQLFMAAAGAVLVLTLLAGGLAARDVVRGRQLAAARSAFLAGVTHEIKTPITSIRLMAETLQQGRAEPGSSGELLGTIVNEAEHLSDMVDNLLSTSRIESGAQTSPAAPHLARRCSA